jgi:TolB protein
MRSFSLPWTRAFACGAATMLVTGGCDPAPEPHPELGLFEAATDVGEPALPGSTTFDPRTGEYLVSGGGPNMWGESDEFHFVWKRMSGDFILQARAEFLGEGVDPHRKLGWMVRSELDGSAAYVDVAVHGDGLTSLQFRREQGGDTEEIRSSTSAPDVIQLERRGGRYTISVARFGEPLTSQHVDGIELGDSVYVGLFLCSHDAGVLESAVFRDVRISIPADEGFVPYRDYIGSNLEILDVETGRREIVYASAEPFEAPNWTPDGRTLIFNSGGYLYRLDLESGARERIDTGFADRNNNDHVLSFDGRMIGISHHSADHNGQSIIYTLPVEGGTPTLVTANGPSYLHGWSPDGRYLVYTGGRDGQYDIYRIAVEGGDEVRLTASGALDDGPEYSPDGRYIYFNSARSGRMQIWRMAPDGSGQEQVTDDQFNNWFPHISPDGRTIIFLSYGAHVDPSDHPYYEQVMLRVMPAEGGESMVVAYLYGGQGTINVPSWAPDSRRVAFVSNPAGN